MLLLETRFPFLARTGLCFWSVSCFWWVPSICTFGGVHSGTLLVTCWAQSAKKVSKWRSLGIDFGDFVGLRWKSENWSPSAAKALFFRVRGGRYWQFLVTSFHVFFRLLLRGPWRGVLFDMGRFWSHFWVPFGGTFGNKASLGTVNLVPFAPSGSRGAAGVDFW